MFIVIEKQRDTASGDYPAGEYTDRLPGLMAETEAGQPASDQADDPDDKEPHVAPQASWFFIPPKYLWARRLFFGEDEVRDPVRPRNNPHACRAHRYFRVIQPVATGVKVTGELSIILLLCQQPIYTFRES